MTRRNVRKRSPSFWRRTFIDQAWRIMYPNEELK
jgi:hypothetical protein